MNEAAPLCVEPLHRQLLDGVPDPSSDATPRRIDVGLLLWCEDERPLRGLAGFVDWRSGGQLSDLIRSGWCTGRAGESMLLPIAGHLPMRRLVMHGLGPSSALTPSHAAEGAKRAVQVARGLDPDEVLIAFPGVPVDRDCVEAMFGGVVDALGSRQPGGIPWWVVADPRHIMRLRRLLEGPPRAAEV